MKIIVTNLGLLLPVSAASGFRPAVRTATGLTFGSAFFPVVSILSLVSPVPAVTGPYPIVEECLS
jgi:hypothetical protein